MTTNKKPYLEDIKVGDEVILQSTNTMFELANVVRLTNKGIIIKEHLVKGEIYRFGATKYSKVTGNVYGTSYSDIRRLIPVSPGSLKLVEASKYMKLEALIGAE